MVERRGWPKDGYSEDGLSSHGSVTQLDKIRSTYILGFTVHSQVSMGTNIREGVGFLHFQVVIEGLKVNAFFVYIESVTLGNSAIMKFFFNSF